MSITDELRNYTEEQIKWLDMTKVHYRKLLAIADRIDAEHEAMLVDARKTVYQGYIELPKDADGEYIHFGDVLDQFGTPMTVFAMSDPDPDQGDCMLELITDGISDGMWVRARKMRHYHAPTVEDVLREFTDEVWNRCCEGATASDSGIDELVAECAAKLRLAGEDA